MRDKKLRVLIAEGSSGEATRALRMLYPPDRESLELTLVSTVSTLIATTDIVNPELILLELSVAQSDPIEAVRIVHRAAPGAPLVVIADVTNKNLADRSLSQGAFDYLLKGAMDTHTVERVLRAALEQNTLEGLANLLRDNLTGLYIRDGLLSLGVRAMESARRNGTTLVLLCLRIENLAKVRETSGASAAESALREVAALLEGSFRRTDIVARLGESQFAALAVNAVEPSGPVLCQRVERRIAVLNHEMRFSGPLEVRLNAGFWSAADSRSFPELLDAVESGLRAAPAGVFAVDFPG